MERSRCLALAYLDRRAEAEACYQWVLAQLETLNEQGELANTLQAYAGLEVDGANYAHAEDLARRALEIADGMDVLLYRGRIHLLLGDIALRRGLIADALQACEIALSEFSQARAPRWEANTMFKVAQLHEELGDFDEAYSFLSGALNRLSARDAPSRWAKGMELFSDLERDHGHLDSAYLWMRAAEHIYTQLDMAGDLDAAVLAHIGIDLQRGNLDSVAQELSAREPSLPTHATEFNLLTADLDLHLGRFENARLRLDKLQSEPASLQAQIYLSRLEGEYRSARKDVHGALAELLDQGKSIQELAGHTQNGILRELIARQAAPLRQTAFRIVLEHHRAPASSGWTTGDVWDWLALTTSELRSPGEIRRGGKTAEKFDNALSAELFSGASATHAAAELTTQRELLSLMAAPGKTSDANAPLRAFKLESLQRRLPPDSAFVAFLDGGTRGAVLWVTREQADFASSAQPGEVRAAIMELRDLVRSPDSSSAEIQVLAQRLSSELFRGMQAAQPPRHLYVLAEEPFNAVPWSVLMWPRAKSFLLDTTSVEYVRLDSGEDDNENPLPIALQVVVAAQQGANSILPALPGAATEATAIGQAMMSAAIPIQIPGATRTAVTSALQEPGAWVHIAAHGMAQPQRIGFAGIWLEPIGDELAPQFLSWIDVLDSGVSADLVVLNACQLADSGTAVNGNLSFADAVSRAGAKHVVASLWPVSDAASALWVPAFYGAITADPYHDPAAALRAAQLRLRESRAFRHPFFWAGMQVIDRMPIGSKATH
jgi:CHAT domain-containing protein/tetratricopeptide (TPR) repeat protein